MSINSRQILSFYTFIRFTEFPNGNFKDTDPHSKTSHNNVYEEAGALPTKDGAIMQETERDNGYSSLPSSNSAVNPVYATLQPVDAGNVDLQVNTTSNS